MEDIRKIWFKELSKEKAVEANECLVTINDIGAIAGGPTLDEVFKVHEALKKFKKITGLDARVVLDSFLDEGWCYGNEFIPESYFEEGEQ